MMQTARRDRRALPAGGRTRHRAARPGRPRLRRSHRRRARPRRRPARRPAGPGPRVGAVAGAGGHLGRRARAPVRRAPPALRVRGPHAAAAARPRHRPARRAEAPRAHRA
ncbi:hypothetical protein FMM08_05210 [Quadrisphaera setariae]|uniref:Uncharacterized protein n=1 Tax=Quadrisphaera setariae TaxID=2593304 RepID=A0A5C8ZKC5_9ACTN|nr:hypothetical protein FMM08_05210 [Quadrisphaera setariae]